MLMDETSNDVLIGMDFLRQFKLVLFVHPNAPIISLIDETLVDEFMKRLTDAVERTVSESSPQKDSQ